MCLFVALRPMLPSIGSILSMNMYITTNRLGSCMVETGLQYFLKTSPQSGDILARKIFSQRLDM